MAETWTLERVREVYPMVNYGPSWAVTAEGEWDLPKYTLGWECLGWASEWLVNPEGEPWIFTPEQARLILWLYACDERGNRLYMKSVIQRAKGWGKDPLAAVVCLFELMGPCRFSHWGRDGQPVGKQCPAAWVQLAATTSDQNKNTMKLIPSLLPKRTREFYKLDVQKQIIHVSGTGKSLEAISSNFRGAEGNRPTFILLNETHHWTPSQGGIDLYETLTNNAEKVGGWYLCITNAYMPGQGSVAENIRQAVMKEREGLAHDSGWFFDSLEAHPDAPMTPGISIHILKGVYGDSYWAPLESIAKNKLLDTAVSPARLRRMFYNQIVTAEDALFSEAEWDGIAKYELDAEGNRIRPATLNRGDEIVLGFDGGKTDDATALIAMRVRDRLAVPIHIWQKPEGPGGDGWRINELEVDSMVHMAFREYKVKAFFADVHLWESYIAEWGDLYRETLAIKASPQSAIGYDMRQNRKALTLGNEALMQSILDKKTCHNADPLLRRHALNAKRRENEFGISFGKESRESVNKVDAYAALLLCHMAITKLAEAAPQRVKRPGTFHQF